VVAVVVCLKPLEFTSFLFGTNAGLRAVVVSLKPLEWSYANILFSATPQLWWLW